MSILAFTNIYEIVCYIWTKIPILLMYTAKNKYGGINFTASLHFGRYKHNPYNSLTSRPTLFSKERRITLQTCLFAKKISITLQLLHWFSHTYIQILSILLYLHNPLQHWIFLIFPHFKQHTAYINILLFLAISSTSTIIS